MSLGVKTRKGHDYLVFTGGRGNELHLGPANDPSKINSDRVLEALEYVKGRNVHYSEIEDKLVSFLPPEKKDRYLSKRIEELYKITDKHILSLSDPELKRQYSGDRTKVRQLEEIPEITTEEIVKISHSTLTKAAAASPTSRKQFDERLEKIKKKKSKKSEETNE